MCYLDVVPVKRNLPTIDKVNQRLQGALTDSLWSGSSNFVLETILSNFPMKVFVKSYHNASKK